MTKRFACQCLRLLIGLVFLGSLATSANAAVVNPNVGGSYLVTWNDGLGQIDLIDDNPDSEFMITVAQDSILSFVSILDCCRPGDMFDVTLDGFVVPWTTQSGGTTTNFTATLADLFLSAGTHSISLIVTQLALQTTGEPFLVGDAFVDIGTVSAVPLPPAFALMLAGLCGLGVFRRWRG